MDKIIIRDLPQAKALDQQAMQAIRGGRIKLRVLPDEATEESRYGSGESLHSHDWPIWFDHGPL